MILSRGLKDYDILVRTAGLEPARIPRVICKINPTSIHKYVMHQTKLAITGHTSGLGACLAQRYPHLGFSRSNGFNITNPHPIILGLEDCEVFVNNAYSGPAQVELLYEVFAAWKGQHRLIINISSNSPDGIKKIEHRYAAYKAALDRASEQLGYLGDACRVVNIRPGWICTPRSAGLTTDKMLSPNTVVDQIENIIDLWESGRALVLSQTLIP